jgi:hypothetical protein
MNCRIEKEDKGMGKGLVFIACIAGLVLKSFAGTNSGSIDSAKVSRTDRLNADKEELRQIKLVDSVGWDAVKELSRPDQKVGQEEKEMLQRKVGALMGFCSESNFSTLSEVDSLNGMTAEEKAFCKRRLRVVNPTMPKGGN